MKSSRTVESPVLFLSVLSSLLPSVCALLLLLSASRAAAAEEYCLQSHRDGAGVCLSGVSRMARDHPCRRGYITVLNPL